MRKLYQRLVLLYLISALLFVLLFAVSLYLRGRKENGYYLYQLLGAVDSNLEEAAGEYEEEVRHLSGEYTTYAREVAYILAREERMAEAEGLETLRELMDVGAISLFDEKGEVVVTTEESLQGSRVDPECMDGEEKTCVQVDEPDFWDRPAYFYVVAPMENVEDGSFAGVRIDADIESIVVEKCTYHETSDLSAAFKVKARINPPADMESVIERWGIVVRKSDDSLGDNMIMADGEDKYSHTFEFVQQIYRGDCKIDEENYKATCDLEILIYVDIYPYVHYLVPRSYTVVYDEKPSIRYTQASLVTELCDVENHNVMEDAIHYAYEVTGAFWLDDNLVTYWDGPEGWHKGGTSYMGDYVIEGDFFYSHFLFTDLHPTTEYLIATRHGVEFMSSNHLVFGWSGDKVTSVEIVE